MKRTSQLAVWAMVLGIAPLCLVFVGPGIILAIPAAITALVLGSIAMKETHPTRGTMNGRGMAVAGIVLGSIGIGMVILIPILLFIMCTGAANSTSESCGDGCESCSEACLCGGSSVVAFLPFAFIRAPGSLVPRLRWLAPRAFSWSTGLAHHPSTPPFDADVYRIRAGLFCIGCFTTWPLFALGIVALPLAEISPIIAITIGAVLAATQAVSTAGRARRRWQKVVVKASLGIGMALLVTGIQSTTLPLPIQAGLLVALALAAVASTVPRDRRLATARALAA